MSLNECTRMRCAEKKQELWMFFVFFLRLNNTSQLQTNWQVTDKQPKYPSPSPKVLYVACSCSTARTLPDTGAKWFIISQLQTPALFPCWTALFTHGRPDVSEMTAHSLPPRLAFDSTPPPLPSWMPSWTVLWLASFELDYWLKVPDTKL